MKNAALLKVLVLSIITSMSYGGFRLKFKVSDEVKKNPNFIAFQQEIIDTLPEKVKNEIGKKIEIKFVKFDKNKGLKRLPVDKCEKGKRKARYGKVNTFKRHKIELTRLFLPEITAGPEDSGQFNCGHGSYYKEALATVLHEIGHVYDLERVRTKEQLAEGAKCAKRKRDKKVLNAKCRALYKQYRNKKSISGLHEFRKLTGWKTGMFSSDFTNSSVKRSPDRYENKNIEEHFSVNFEYFLLNKEYKCRRPSYYNFFKEKLDHVPFPNYDCEVMTKIRLDDKKTIVDIHPDRVYRVEYLLASKGSSMISGFGHSMYRLVLCAPFRTKVDENCLKDKLYHVVLSYRANVDDLKTNMLKGVSGGYDSVLFMLSMPQVIKEYNLGELRDLIGLPLHLSEEDKKNFIYRTLETYWEYAGSYKFVSNNCATESNALLQSAMLKHDISYGDIILPYSLYDKLIDKELSSEEYYEDMEKAVKDRILFKSDVERLKKIKLALFGEEEEDFKIVYRRQPHKKSHARKKFKKRKEIRDIIEQQSYEKILAKFEEISEEEDSEEKVTKLKYISTLAGAILNIRQKKLDEEIGSFLEKEEKEKTTLGKLVNEWNKLRRKSRFTSTDRGYGIPFEISVKDKEVNEGNELEREGAEEKILKIVMDKYQGPVDNLLNLKKLVENARTLRKKVDLSL